MRSRILFGALILMVGLAAGSVAAGGGAAPAVKWAVVNLSQPTMIAGTLVVGPVMFMHDDAKMARGEACTSVHRFWPAGPAEQIVAFHCKPRWVHAPGKFTAAVKDDTTGGRTLTEYQFAGDAEAHGVPATETQAAAPHDMKDMKGMHCADCAKDMKCGDGCKDCGGAKDCKDCKSCKH